MQRDSSFLIRWWLRKLIHYSRVNKKKYADFCHADFTLRHLITEWLSLNKVSLISKINSYSKWGNDVKFHINIISYNVGSHLFTEPKTKVYQ